MTTNTDFRPATPAQLAALKVMIKERNVSAIAAEVDAARDAAIHGRFSIADASHLFTLVKAQPKLAGADPMSPGVYRGKDGELYRVYPARADRSRLLAKRVVVGESWEGDDAPHRVAFEYAGAASRFVTAEGRLSREEAEAFGRETGWCIVCGTELTDPDSIALGIGPVCARNYA